jgi:hypothetical protein
MQCVGRFKLSRNQGSSQLAKPRDSRSVLVVAEVGAFTGAAIFLPIGEPTRICGTFPEQCLPGSTIFTALPVNHK